MKTKHTKFRPVNTAPKPSFVKQNSALLGVGAAVIVGLFLIHPFSISSKANATDVKAYVMQGISSPLEAFRHNTGTYPGTAQGLKALVTRPEDSASWAGPYLKDDAVPKDPWGSPYQYAYPGNHNGAKKYDVWSKGPDKLTGTADDIGNW